MVSRYAASPPAPAAAPTSRDRLLRAAAEEFAARGFDGAKVDRIAARARVNKALLYYYFRSKAALYREVLRDLFGTIARAVAAARDETSPPEAQLERYIETLAGEIVRRPLFPALWLREMAEGGRHVDESIVAEMKRVLEQLGAILQEGRRAGAFVDANPFVIQVGIVAPLLFFAATAPIRERFRGSAPPAVSAIPREAVLEHVRAATLSVLGVGSGVRGAAPRSRRHVR